jgi:hypothetical protein
LESAKAVACHRRNGSRSYAWALTGAVVEGKATRLKPLSTVRIGKASLVVEGPKEEKEQERRNRSKNGHENQELRRRKHARECGTDRASEASLSVQANGRKASSLRDELRDSGPMRGLRNFT